MPSIHKKDPVVGRMAGYHAMPSLVKDSTKVHVELSPIKDQDDFLEKFKLDEKAFESSKKMALEYEKELFTFALENKVCQFYEVVFTVDNTDLEKGVFRIDNYFKFLIDKKEAEHLRESCDGRIKEWNFENLAKMPEDEFENLSSFYGKKSNYELVKKWREAIRENHELS